MESGVLSEPPPDMRVQPTRRPSLRSGRSLYSLGSPLNAHPLGDLTGSRWMADQL